MKFTILPVFLAVAAAFANAEPGLLKFNHENPLVVRDYVSKEVAHELYEALREVGFPASKDEEIHPHLVSIHGDDGTQVEVEPPAHEAMDHVYRPDSKQSVVLRLEHMADYNYELSHALVNEVVPNHVLEDGGTIHLYVSSPGASALANHTDTTDIFVLHLDGAKEWVLCEEHEEDPNDALTHKLDTCSTYAQKEIETLDCRRSTLYPGDALFLPMRVVHSARAVPVKPSAHLTFGFANHEAEEGSCQESYPDFPFLATSKQRKLTCNKSCVEHRDCDDGIGIFCDSWFECDGSSCDSSCNSGCNEVFWSCDKSCDSGCDTCN